MKISSINIRDGQPIPGAYAFAVPDPESRVALSNNYNPEISWEDLPPDTASLVLICHDPDVPTKPDDVNQEGRIVPADLPRCDFYHWVLVDIPPALGAIAECEHSGRVTPRGKNGPDAPSGMRHGINSYTDWFAGDPDMEGQYFGYDGLCPPWNDSIVHRYVFTLYALSTERFPLEEAFTAPDVLRAMEPYVLDKASITGTYSLNPDVPA